MKPQFVFMLLLLVLLVFIPFSLSITQKTTESIIIEGLVAPFGIAVGGGSVYITDTGAKRIFKFDSTTGAQQAFATNNAVQWSMGIRFGPSDGNLYLADQNTNAVFKLDTSGTVLQTFTTSPPLQQPTCVAIDTGGNVYIGDSNGNRVVKLNPSGIQLLTFTTTGTALNYVNGVALDSSGNVYISDWHNARVVKMAPSGGAAAPLQIFTTSSPVLNGPAGLVVAANGDVYVADQNNGRIVQFNATGSVVQTWTDSSLGLNQPVDVAVDVSHNVYAVDHNNARGVQWTSSNTISAQSYVSLDHPLWNNDHYITFDNTGNLYVAELDQITKLSADGRTVLHIFTASGLSNPQGVAVDPSNGDVYTVSQGSNNIYKWNSAGTQASGYETTTAAAGLSSAYGLALDSLYLYIADGGNHQILVLNKGAGTVATTIGSLNFPAGVFRQGNNLYVGDYGAGQILTYDVSGSITPTTPTLSVSQPRDVFVDAVGNIFAVQHNINSIRAFNSAGTELEDYSIDAPYQPVQASSGAINPVTGDMYLNDQYRIVVFDAISGSLTGDPAFVGFQGQEFQIHGTPDEWFSLISAPSWYCNAHFTFLSQAGATEKYQDTAPFSHPGTYVDALACGCQDTRIEIVTGTHKQGFTSMNVNGIAMNVNDTLIQTCSSNNNATTWEITYLTHSRIRITIDSISLVLANSHWFMNMESRLIDRRIIELGSHKLVLNDQQVQSGAATDLLKQKYPLDESQQLHGLLGQTWRYVVHPHQRVYQGNPDEYQVGEAHATEFEYSLYHD